MKRIFIIILCIFLIGIVSANPVKDFWESKGLSPGEAKSISEGNANSSTTLKAQVLQNDKPSINETEIIQEQERISKNRWGLFYFIILGIMVLFSLGFLIKRFFGEGRA